MAGRCDEEFGSILPEPLEVSSQMAGFSHGIWKGFILLAHDGFGVSSAAVGLFSIVPSLSPHKQFQSVPSQIKRLCVKITLICWFLIGCL